MRKLHYHISSVVFGGHLDNGRSLDEIDRKLLIPALKSILQNPNGGARSTASGIFKRLSDEELDQLYGDIYVAAKKKAPSGVKIEDPAMDPAAVKFGPEYTFGIYMQKHLNEPIMVIKTAWGGRDLLQQFRPPSAGEYEKDKCKHGMDTGGYYKLMIQLVEKTLANLGDYHPDYDPKLGYEITGFVWFRAY